MASAMVKSALRNMHCRTLSPYIRTFSSHANGIDDARETTKWEKITYAGILTCSVLAFYILSKGHPHFDEPPVQMGYLRLRNTDHVLTSLVDPNLWVFDGGSNKFARFGLK